MKIHPAVIWDIERRERERREREIEESRRLPLYPPLPPPPLRAPPGSRDGVNRRARVTGSAGNFVRWPVHWKNYETDLICCRGSADAGWQHTCC